MFRVSRAIPIVYSSLNGGIVAPKWNPIAKIGSITAGLGDIRLVLQAEITDTTSEHES